MVIFKYFPQLLGIGVIAPSLQKQGIAKIAKKETSLRIEIYSVNNVKKIIKRHQYKKLDRLG